MTNVDEHSGMWYMKFGVVTSAWQVPKSSKFGETETSEHERRQGVQNFRKFSNTSRVTEGIFEGAKPVTKNAKKAPKNPFFARAARTGVFQLKFDEVGRCILRQLPHADVLEHGSFLWPLPALLLTWRNPELVRWYWWGLVLPTIFNSLVGYGLNTVYLNAVQQYAHLTSLTDHLFGTFSGWLASGDATATKKTNPDSNSNSASAARKDDESTPLLGAGNAKASSSSAAASKYNQMRVLCAVWVYGTTVALVAGVALQITRGYRWYEFVPALLCAGYEAWRTWAFVWWV
ncbi:hypothetical protein B0H13DRAFT_1864764 [Mycena leptocephala]|nr:hypothetical protein B0H13DRAFT_1864764 [Mycena leptocephala]